jgi:flavodoxin
LLYPAELQAHCRVAKYSINKIIVKKLYTLRRGSGISVEYGTYKVSSGNSTQKGAHTMVSGNNVLVLFYSRTGNCRAVARAIGETLNCPVQEIQDLKDRSGFWGFISGMIDIRKRPITEIAPKTLDLSACDTIYLGSPIWGMRFAPAITTVLGAFDFAGKKIVLFAVVAGKFKQEKIDAYAQALSAKGARAGASFVIKTMNKSPDLLRQEAQKAVAALNKQ